MSIITRTVSYTDSTGTTLQSYFAYPAQGGKFAAVMVAPEWWGLSEHAKNSAERLAAIGFCFGGKVVLEAARHGAPLKAVVTFHGNLTPFEAAAKGKIQGELLIEHGELDTLVTMESVEAFRAEMTAAEARFRIDVLPNAKHGFTNPQATANGERNGVDLAYQQEAAEQSWQNMLDLFKRVL